MVCLHPLAVRRRQQDGSDAGGQIVAPLVDDPQVAVGDADAPEGIGGNLVSIGAIERLERTREHPVGDEARHRQPADAELLERRQAAGLAQQRLHVDVAPQRVRGHLDARCERQQAGLQHDARAPPAEPVREVVGGEVELVAADRHRAQRAAFHLPGIVRLEDARTALDVVRRECRGAPQQRLVLEAQRDRQNERERQADERQQGEPEQQFLHGVV